jgi:hypothetical protein
MSSTPVRGLAAFLSMALVCFSVAILPTRGQEPRADDVHGLMKQKLRHAQFLLDGLAREDFSLIHDHASELKKLGSESLKRVSPNLTYVKYSAEFVSILDELDRRAKEQDLNGATLSYIRLTINCVECHKFTRDNRIMDQRPQPK